MCVSVSCTQPVTQRAGPARIVLAHKRPANLHLPVADGKPTSAAIGGQDRRACSARHPDRVVDPASVLSRSPRRIWTPDRQHILSGNVGPRHRLPLSVKRFYDIGHRCKVAGRPRRERTLCLVSKVSKRRSPRKRECQSSRRESYLSFHREFYIAAKIPWRRSSLWAARSAVQTSSERRPVPKACQVKQVSAQGKGPRRACPRDPIISVCMKGSEAEADRQGPAKGLIIVFADAVVKARKAEAHIIG